MELTLFEPRDLFETLRTGLWPETGPGTREFRADLMEREDEVVLTADLPGVRRDDLDVTLEQNVLTVTGERTQPRPERNGEDRYYLFERRWGRFRRSFALPCEVMADRVDATLSDGVLTVRIPKAESSRRRRIEIQSGAGRRELAAATS